MCEDYTSEHLYSTKFREKSNVLKMISAYDTIPIPVIKFALLVCKDYVYEAIISIMKGRNTNRENLMDCVISSSKIKLCGMRIFAPICKQECVCMKKIKFNKLYDKLVDLIEDTPEYLGDIAFVNNFSCLIRRTNVYTNKLFNCIKTLHKSSNRNANCAFNPILLVNVIISSCLFSDVYRDIVEEIKNNSTNKDVKMMCKRAMGVINMHNRQCTHIQSNIYISNIDYANSTSSIIDEGYNYVVSITTKEMLFPVNPNIIYYQVPIPDNTTIDFLHKTTNLLKKTLKVIGKKKILVHCYAGLSRSVIFTALLIKYADNVSFDKSLKIVKKHRKMSMPNPDIIKQIKDKLKKGFNLYSIKKTKPQAKIHRAKSDDSNSTDTSSSNGNGNSNGNSDENENKNDSELNTQKPENY